MKNQKENFSEAELKVIGKTIKRIREEKGITQQKLSSTTDIKSTSISEIENGRNPNPSWRTLKKIADGLSVSIFELFVPERTLCDSDPDGLKEFIERQDELLPPIEPRSSQFELDLLRRIPHPFLSPEAYRQILLSIRDALRSGQSVDRIRIVPTDDLENEIDECK